MLSLLDLHFNYVYLVPLLRHSLLWGNLPNIQ